MKIVNGKRVEESAADLARRKDDLNRHSGKREARAAQAAIAKRDRLLGKTDRLLLPDAPISTVELDAVKKERQALWAITEQKGFPYEIVWPDKPLI